MKSLALLICVLITANTFSQQVSLEKLWTSNENIYLLADAETIRFETFYPGLGNTRIAKKYLIKEDTLRIFQNDFNYKNLTADFLIVAHKKNEITLIPAEINASLLTNLITGKGVKKELRFTDINSVYTDTILFEKIIFNSTTCYGRCPDMTLLVNNKKQVLFTGKEYAVKQGSFTANMPDALFYELIEILRLSELDKIESNKYRNIDAPTYTIEIHYNNKTKYLRSCMLPFVTDDLVKYLLALPGKLKLTETKDVIEIKFSKK